MKQSSIRQLSLVVALVSLIALPASAQVSLGSAQSFAVLGGSSVTNTGPSSITGEVGVFPGTSVTGFPPGIVVGGSIHSADAVAGQAQSDLTAAYNAVAGTACNVDLTGQNLGGLTLTPGVYCFSSSAFLTGTLTLDFQGNPNAVFLFKIGSTLITSSASTVVVINSGGNACPANLFWQVGSSATFGTGSSFVGNVLAQESITLTTGARLSGRALARTGAVTLDTNTVSICGPAIACPVITVNPATLPNAEVGIAYNANVTASGGVGPYSFAVSSGALPGGLTLNGATGEISGSPTTAGTFNFTITATDTASGCFGFRAYTVLVAGAGCPVISLTPATLAPPVVGVPYSQTISATGGTGTITFTIAGGALPAGLSLNGVTGVISGTPATAGLFTVTIRATDSVGCPGTRTFTGVITAGTPMAIPALDYAGLAIMALLLAGVAFFAMNRS